MATPELQTTTAERERFLAFIEDIEDTYAVGNHVKPFVRFIRERDLQITGESLQAYLDYLKESGYAARTINVRISAVKARIRQLFEAHPDSFDAGKVLLLERALGKLKPLKVNSVAISTDKVLSPEEIHRLITEAEDRTVSMFVAFLSFTGCRISEALDVRLSDLTPVPPKRTTHFDVRLRGGKGGKERIVYLGKDLYDRLREHFKGDSWLFEHSGKQYSRVAISNRIAWMGKLVLGRDISAHTLRHSFATARIKSGKDLKAVSTYLGHSSVSTTADLYVHSILNREDVKDFARDLPPIPD